MEDFGGAAFTGGGGSAHAAVADEGRQSLREARDLDQGLLGGNQGSE